MNLDGLIRRVLRLFAGKVVRAATRAGTRSGAPAPKPGGVRPKGPEAPTQAARREAVKRARQAARITRRLGR